MDNVAKFLREIKIYDCHLTKTRIGDEQDGGYVALKEICEKTDVLYTLGVGDDVSFEMDFMNRFPVKEIKLFDPAIRRSPVEQSKFVFFKIRVGPKHHTLNDIWKDGFSRALLKMDVEWDEWEILKQVSNKELLKYDQLLIEFHVIPVKFFPGPQEKVMDFPYTPYFRGFLESVHDKINDILFGMYYEVMKKLNWLFYGYHIHANNSLAKINVNGHSFPPLIEMSFVRKDLVGRIPETTHSFPIGGLDYPNKSDRKDITNFYPLGGQSEQQIKASQERYHNPV